VKEIYIETILLIERLHRRLLDVLKSELERLQIVDVNNIQALILYNIGDATLTVGELTNRGYYLGSNVSYNVKSLVQTGYLVQEKTPHDKRATHIKLSPKAAALIAKIDALFEQNVNDINGMQLGADLSATNKTMHALERYWMEVMNRRHPASAVTS
jgi:DNA-binding MarR family transcriptional regulator